MDRQVILGLMDILMNRDKIKNSVINFTITVLTEVAIGNGDKYPNNVDQEWIHWALKQKREEDPS